MKQQQEGFTLVELMIVVAIIAILASVALPAYSEYVLRGKLVEAKTQLASLRVRLEQYYQDNRNYASTAGACGVAMPSEKYFTYSCNWGTGGTDQSYKITATGVTTQGTGDFTYTIDHLNAKATTGVPTGWTANSTCWVTRKDGSC